MLVGEKMKFPLLVSSTPFWSVPRQIDQSFASYTTLKMDAVLQRKIIRLISTDQGRYIQSFLASSQLKDKLLSLVI